MTDMESWLAERFEEHRAHLRAVAHRMLGSASEAEDAAVEMGATREVRGAAAVAEALAGRARAARPALVDGAVGLVWAVGGRPRVVFGLTFSNGTISGIELIADAERLRRLTLESIDG